MLRLSAVCLTAKVTFSSVAGFQRWSRLVSVLVHEEGRKCCLVSWKPVEMLMALLNVCTVHMVVVSVEETAPPAGLKPDREQFGPSITNAAC